MQVEDKEEGRLVVLLKRATCDNLMSILGFLGRDGVREIVEACGQGEGEAKFLSLCGVCNFVNDYLTRTDRSLYMSFYD